MLPFADRLDAAIRRCKNPVLVGLDPRAESLPERILPSRKALEEEKAAAYRQFCRGVIDVVAPLVPAVKPQAAFFEQLGPAGMIALAKVVDYASQKGLLVILDGKRNDIGSTATAYAEGMLGSGGQSPWGADALTVSPYLGDDSLQPFIDVAVQRGRRASSFLSKPRIRAGGCCRIFWPTAGRSIATWPITSSGRPRQRRAACGYGVVGAWSERPIRLNWPSFGRPCRILCSSCPVSAARADGRDVAAAFDLQGRGAVVNNSRGIIFAHISSRIPSDSAASVGRKRLRPPRGT